jgi:plasmid maintenance system antidote protein VapI
MAHVEGGLSMSALARAIGLSVSRVSRIIAGVEAATGLKEAKGKT